MKRALASFFTIVSILCMVEINDAYSYTDEWNGDKITNTSKSSLNKECFDTTDTFSSNIDTSTLPLLNSGNNSTLDYGAQLPTVREKRFSSVNMEISSPPITAALWLFGSGIIGLIGIRGKFNS